MGQIIQMFSHPVITIDDFPEIDTIAGRFYDKAMALMDEFPDAGLISDAWHSGQRASSPDDIKRHGFTSFHSVNLARRADFEFMNKAALEVFASYLTHNTEAHESDDYRVIYSANVQLDFARLTDADKR